MNKQGEDAASQNWWDGRIASTFFPSVYYEGDSSVEGFHNDIALTREVRTRRECEQIEIRINRHFGKRSTGALKILDCPCGEGRHSMELAKRGYSVHGIDLCPRAIETARKNLLLESAEVQNRCTFSEGDMRTLSNISTDYDLVINMFFSFGFFSDKENSKTLGAFASVLKRGGLLLIHTDVNPYLIEAGAYGDRKLRTTTNGDSLEVDERFDHVTSRLNGTWTLRKAGGNQTMAAYSVRIYETPDLQRLMLEQRLQFLGEEAVPLFSLAKPVEESPELIYLAKKV